MIIPKSLIDHLEHEINIGNVDKKVQNLILIISEENQKLKKQLEIKHDGFMASVEESCELAKENQELKKQLEKKYEKVGTLTGELLCEENTKLINQQKEFIEYLENEIKRLESNNIYEPLQKMALVTHQHNLSRYKEIIGDKE